MSELSAQYATYSEYLAATPLPDVRPARRTRSVYYVDVTWSAAVTFTGVVETRKALGYLARTPEEALTAARAEWVDDPDLWVPATSVELSA